MQSIETTQATIAHPSAPTIMFLSRAKLRSAPSDDQGGFMRYARFTSSGATDGSSNRNYLPQDSTELSMLQIMITDMITGVIGLSTGKFKIVEQRSQIVWQLRKGSIMTPKGSKVASRYDSLLLLTIIAIGT